MVRIVGGRRVTVYRSDLVLGLITCEVRRIGQVARLFGARADVRLTGAFGWETVRQGSRRSQGREGGLEVTVREQQGRRMKHEKREGEMDRYDITANTLSHACARCLYVTHRKCQEKVRATRSVCPLLFIMLLVTLAVLGTNTLTVLLPWQEASSLQTTSRPSGWTDVFFFAVSFPCG